MAVSAPTPAVRLEERRWTAGEVERIVEAGILGEDEPLEPYGRLVVASPQGARHSALIAQLTEFRVASYAGARRRAERARARPGGRAWQRPRPSGPPTGVVDAIPVVEVAVTAHPEAVGRPASTRRLVRPRTGLIDVARRRAEVMEEPDPSGTDARSTLVAEDGELTLPGLAQTLPVRDLL